MSGFKRSQPGLIFPPEKISPDEIDRYEVYTIVNPNTLNANQWFGTATAGGTSSAAALVVVNAISDYPRNLEWSMTGTGAGMAGTVTAAGFDQFGSVISETIAIGTASNGGTTVGSRVFAQLTSGTISWGTAVGNGTPRLGVGTTGTTTIFGLPVKIGAATDLKMLCVTAGTGAVSVNGGTIAAYADTTNHAIKLPVPQTTGTMSIQAWVKSSFDPTNINIVANLPQRT